MIEWCVYFFIFTAIFYCLELNIKEGQIDSSGGESGVYVT